MSASTCDNEAWPQGAENTKRPLTQPDSDRRAPMSLAPAEEWRSIPGFPHYEVSNLGRVRSLDRPYHPGRVLKQQCVNWTEERGYRQVVLRENYRTHTMKVHRLVAMAFLPNRSDYPQVRHLDGNPENNWVGNLAWGTNSDNTVDQVRHGTHHRARVTHCPNGHPYAGEYLQIADGNRRCRTCRNQRRRINAGASNQKRPTAPHGFKGVAFNKKAGRWTAQIAKGDGRMRYLGIFDDIEDAARAYDEAAAARWGEEAMLNFPRKAHA